MVTEARGPLRRIVDAEVDWVIPDHAGDTPFWIAVVVEVLECGHRRRKRVDDKLAARRRCQDCEDHLTAYPVKLLPLTDVEKAGMPMVCMFCRRVYRIGDPDLPTSNGLCPPEGRTQECRNYEAVATFGFDPDLDEEDEDAE